MTDQDPLDHLRQALAIAPSPEFATRVRQQVAMQPARATWWWVGPCAAAAAAVCVMALAVSVSVSRWGRGGAPGVGSVVPVVSAVPAVPDVTPTPLSAVAYGVTTNALTRPRTSPVAAAAAADVFAESLVPDDQRLALERLLGAIRAGRATVPAAVAEEIVDEEGRRMPRALVIEPLKLELLIGTPADPNKEPIKESIK